MKTPPTSFSASAGLNVHVPPTFAWVYLREKKKIIINQQEEKITKTILPRFHSLRVYVVKSDPVKAVARRCHPTHDDVLNGTRCTVDFNLWRCFWREKAEASASHRHLVGALEENYVITRWPAMSGHLVDALIEQMQGTSHFFMRAVRKGIRRRGGRNE